MSHITLATVAPTIPWCGWLLARPGLCHSHLTEIDINSGDFRKGLYVGPVPASRRRIRETPLSREARRLGVAIPTTRAWKSAFMDIRRPSGTDILCAYSLVVSAEKHGLDAFDPAFEEQRRRTRGSRNRSQPAAVP